MGKQTGIIIGIIVLLIIAFVGVKALRHTTPQASQSTMENMTMTPSPTDAMSSSPSVSTSSQEVGAVKEFTVTGSNFKFDPSSITVKKGDSVKITFKNSGGLHDFVLDQFNVKTPIISSGQQATVQFVADKAGTFEYYCSVANHRAMGMVGNLIVQ